MFTLEALAVAFATFEVAWLLAVPLWQTRLVAGRSLAFAGTAWVGVAALASWRGWFRAIEAFPPPTILVGATGFLLLLFVLAFVAPVRTASYAIGLRTLVAIHVFRGLVGAALLSMASKSQMGPTLGYGGGVLEAIAGVTALALLVALGRLDIDRRRRWVLGWSALSLLCWFGTMTLWLLSAPSSWQRFGEGALVARLGEFPYAALPVFLWPVTLLGLVVLFVRDSRF